MSKYRAFIIAKEEAEKSYKNVNELVSNIMDMENYLVCETLMMYVNKKEFRIGIEEKKHVNNEKWDSSKSLIENLKRGLRCKIAEGTDHCDEKHMRYYVQENHGQLIFEFGKKFPTHTHYGVRFRQYFEHFDFY